MTTFEEDFSFNCPHCGQENVIRIDLTGGGKQKLVYDCETCCHPIVIKFEKDSEGISNFSAEKE